MVMVEHFTLSNSDSEEEEEGKLLFQQTYESTLETMSSQGF